MLGFISADVPLHARWSKNISHVLAGVDTSMTGTNEGWAIGPAEIAFV
jgi:hypothetical protein